MFLIRSYSINCRLQCVVLVLLFIIVSIDVKRLNVSGLSSKVFALLQQRTRGII